jgi:hypothetical protein
MPLLKGNYSYNNIHNLHITVIFFLYRNDDFIDETSFTDFIVNVVTCKDMCEFLSRFVGTLKNTATGGKSSTSGGHVELSSSDHDVSERGASK